MRAPTAYYSERGEGIRDEEGAPTAYYSERREGIRAEERGPTTYFCYVEVLMSFYVLPILYMRSALNLINCAAILTAISAGVSLPMSIPMGVITRASCCSL